MKMRRSVILISAVTLLALGTGAPPALASPAFGGSSLTINGLSPDTTTPYSGTQDFIYITLSGNAPSGGTVVTTSSSNQSVMPIPASVTVPAGSDSGQVEFTAGNVTTPTQATFTATLGSSSKSVTITVTPTPTPTLFSMELHPSEVIGGGSVTAEPDLNAPAPSGGVTVGLSSSNPALAAVPSSVTIPAGSYLTNVTITTSAVTAVTDVTITATLPSGSLSSTLQIDPPETLSALSLNPTTTSGTNGSSGEVTIGAPAPTDGFTVDLQSSAPSVASVPASAEVPSGSTGTGFTVTTADVTTATTVTITATVGTTSLSATLTVNPPPPVVAALQSVTISPGSVSGGGNATGTVTLTTAAPAGGARVLLASSNTAAASVPASVTVPAGATRATFTVTTHSVSSTTTVSVGGEYGNSDRAALFGVTGGRHGGSVLPPEPSGYTITPFALGPWPENDTQAASPHPIELTLPASTLPASDVSIESGSLPPGLSLATAVAGIQGTPSAQGLFAFVLKFNINGTVFGMPYVWQIVAPLVITQVNLPAGQVGAPYSGGFTVTGGVPPYTWIIAQNALPPGLSINASTGQITGTPTQAGTFNFRARVTDSDETQFFVDSVQSITISS
jgi:trimeric autotransporter adhesin